MNSERNYLIYLVQKWIINAKLRQTKGVAQFANFYSGLTVVLLQAPNGDIVVKSSKPIFRANTNLDQAIKHINQELHKYCKQTKCCCHGKYLVFFSFRTQQRLPANTLLLRVITSLRPIHAYAFIYIFVQKQK